MAANSRPFAALCRIEYMTQAPVRPSAQSGDLVNRQLPLERIQALTTQYDDRGRHAFRNYYVLQGLTIGFAAVTPCLIFLANDNPNNKVFEWLQLFLPALAAITAGMSHVSTGAK